MRQPDPAADRRRFMAWLAGSALAAQASGGRSATFELSDPMIWAPRDVNHPIAAPKDALDVFDFEVAAHAKVPPAHFGYMASGIDDEASLKANREGFKKFQLRPRRLVDVSKVDTAVTLLGQRFPTPIILAPVGGHRAYHPEGELATARGAKAGDHLMILSNQTSTPIEKVIEARGRPIWFQLYPTNKLEVARAMVQHAERAGCPVVAVTVDRKGGRDQETYFRLRAQDTRACGSCHNTPTGPGLPDPDGQPMYNGTDLSGLANTQASVMSWDYLKRIRDATKMKCVLKGVLSPEDARMAADAGYDGVIVSNHGGRADESGVSTIECLPEIVAAVHGRMPVLIDSGFRRGTDIVKALAMGANGVAVGRPYIWGLGGFGQPGVEKVLELLRIELVAAMQQVGAPSIGALNPALVRRA